MVATQGASPGDGDVTPLATDVEVDQVDTDASHEVMNLLGQHVPLALLADLAIPSGPESPQILQDEGLPDVAWWEHEDEEGAPAPDSQDGASVTP